MSHGQNVWRSDLKGNFLEWAVPPLGPSIFAIASSFSIVLCNSSCLPAKMLHGLMTMNHCVEDYFGVHSTGDNLNSVQRNGPSMSQFSDGGIKVCYIGFIEKYHLYNCLSPLSVPLGLWTVPCQLAQYRIAFRDIIFDCKYFRNPRQCGAPAWYLQQMANMFGDFSDEVWVVV